METIFDHAITDEEFAILVADDDIASTREEYIEFVDGDAQMAAIDIFFLLQLRGDEAGARRIIGTIPDEGLRKTFQTTPCLIAGRRLASGQA